MDELYWTEVITLMRSGVAHAVALDMAFDALRLPDHFEAIEHRRRNEVAA